MALTDAQVVDARRYCGYPMFGAGPGDATFQRYTVQYSLLEYRLGSLTAAETTVVVTYLATLNKLEVAIPGAAANLDTDVAAVWTRNKAEVADRTRLFNDWCRRLCGFLGVPPGPALQSAGNSVRIVV